MHSAIYVKNRAHCFFTPIITLMLLVLEKQVGHGQHVPVLCHKLPSVSSRLCTFKTFRCEGLFTSQRCCECKRDISGVSYFKLKALKW